MRNKRVMQLIAGISIAIALAYLTSCTKTNTQPQVRAYIKRNADTLTASGWSTASTKLTFIWIVNDVRTEGVTRLLVPGRNYVQLVARDEYGNSSAEYETIMK